MTEKDPNEKALLALIKMLENTGKLKRIVDFKEIYSVENITNSIKKEIAENVWHEIKMSTSYSQEADEILGTVHLIRYSED